MNNVDTRFIAKCKACGVATSALSRDQDYRRSKDDTKRSTPVYTHANGSIVLDCRACGLPRHAKAVRGTFSRVHVCNAKCLASTGPACECSCGGKNHGASHAA